jgi:hypothetical protein
VAQSLSSVFDLSARPGTTHWAPPKQCVRKYAPSRPLPLMRAPKAGSMRPESRSSRTDSIAEQATITAPAATVFSTPAGSR